MSLNTIGIIIGMFAGIIVIAGVPLAVYKKFIKLDERIKDIETAIEIQSEGFEAIFTQIGTDIGTLQGEVTDNNQIIKEQTQTINAQTQLILDWINCSKDAIKS